MDSLSTTPLVLVADDEPTMLELVARHLKTMIDPKIDVIEASDGEQAWRLAREHLPDLVVLDVMMPGMSGWEVCRKIREDIALAHTGVVMLTGIGENLNQITSPLYGADAYIDKPFEFGELDQKVKDALAARASQREGVSRPPVNGVSGPARSAPRKKKASSAPPKKRAKRSAKATPPKPAAKTIPRKKPIVKKALRKVTSKRGGVRTAARGASKTAAGRLTKKPRVRKAAKKKR
jgi:DNA-binding response OmpR family regulator